MVLRLRSMNNKPLIPSKLINDHTPVNWSRICISSIFFGKDGNCRGNYCKINLSKNIYIDLIINTHIFPFIYFLSFGVCFAHSIVRSKAIPILEYTAIHLTSQCQSFCLKLLWVLPACILMSLHFWCFESSIYIFWARDRSFIQLLSFDLLLCNTLILFCLFRLLMK